MRIVPVMYCILVTAILFAFYIARHNTYIEWQIKGPSLEKEIRMHEAEKRRLELELAHFFSPIRLEEVARKSQYQHLRPLYPEQLFTLSGHED